MTQALVQNIADEMVARPLHSGVAVSIFDRRLGAETHAAAGDLTSRSPYFATGVTKLAVTAILMQLVQEGKLDLNAPFKSYMPGCKVCVEVHVKDRVDYTDTITIRHLMQHRSGLGDYFVYKPSRGKQREFAHPARHGEDSAWSFEDVIMRARAHGGHFPPGTGRKALYSDTNFHILGKVIECIEQQDLADVLQRRICVPLALNSTYLYSDPSDKRPVDPMSGTKKIHIPRLMSSQFSEGGLVMTSRDAMRFTRAFFDGHLFDTRFLAEMMHWVPARPFLDYGLGLQRLRVPWWRALPTRMSGPLKNVFRPGPRVIGHFGLGGTFAIYEPRAGVVAAGTVNQFSDLIHGVIFALRAIEYHRRDRQSLIRSMQCAGADMPHDPMPMDRAE